jgi:hypothetical protein
MRPMLVPLLLIALLPGAALAQSGAGGKALKPCALLTPELVKKVSAASKKSTDVAAPTEVKLGASGIACEWGEIMLQVDPVTPAQLQQLAKPGDKSWESVPGVGDAAWFHNVRDMLGELFVRVGPRTLGVLMDIPAGSTATAFKPVFIDVAKAVLPKLR